MNRTPNLRRIHEFVGSWVSVEFMDHTPSDEDLYGPADVNPATRPGDISPSWEFVGTLFHCIASRYDFGDPP